MALHNLVSQLCRRIVGQPPAPSDPSSDTPRLRICRVEAMEPRQLLAADLQVGSVYIEEDVGSDVSADTFEVTFNGGAAGTRLTQIVIDGDQNSNGIFDEGDVFFDTLPTGIGKTQAWPFAVVTAGAVGDVTLLSHSVSDGGTQLVLNFSGFDAGDKFIFSIDVDEMNDLAPGETDPVKIHQGVDSITSGVEFQGSLLHVQFSSPHFYDVGGSAKFWNEYDDTFTGRSLDLSEDNVGGKQNRTAGAAAQFPQIPLPVTISGTVYLEMNLDLVQDAGEPGLVGVDLSLWKHDGTDYVFTGHTITTDVDGNYEFGLSLNLEPGTYQVRETQPPVFYSVGAVPGTVSGADVGSTVSGDPNVLTEITIPLGDQHAIDYDFAEAQPAQISGYVYHDRNNDGVRDSGEEGIPGIDIEIVPVSTIAAQATVTVTTDANGHYQSPQLVPGTYEIVEPTQPAAYLDGKDTAGTINGITVGVAGDDRIDGVFLGGGKSGIEYNFGELLPTGIQGNVHLSTPDGDCFGVGLTHSPLAGVTVFLLDDTGATIDTDITDADGNYAFAGLLPGTYSVVEVTPRGYIDGGEQIGSHGGTISANDTISAITLASGQTGVNYDFCEHETAFISGFVYHDESNDGIKDSGEAGIGGATVKLLDSAGNVVDSTITAGNGSYLFFGLTAGTYRIVETQPGGWFDGLDMAGTIDGTTVGAAVNPGDEINDITIGWGQSGVNYNFGELLPTGISGHVYLSTPDGDCFGTTVTHAPVVGATVYLQDNAGNTLDTTTTDASGAYSFGNLPPGTYRVVEVTPPGLIDGDEHVGTVGGLITANDTISDITLTSGQAGVNYDFCEHETSEIAGFVYHDRSDDGSRDSGEEGIPGATVTLYDDTGTLVASQTTGADGSYRFTGLSAGTYRVLEAQPDGWFDGLDTAGTISAITVGVAVNPGDEISGITIGWGQAGVEYNFGELQPASISGRIHAESDGDCIVDPGEPMLAGVTVHLLNDSGDVIATTTTDSDGAYRFDGLAPGTYGVREEQPAGYGDGDEHAGSAGGVNSANDEITQVVLGSGVQAVNYDFCEVLLGSISGFVFQDGETLKTPDGLLPANIDQLRDGLRTPDDTPIPGVVMRLTNSSGEPILDESGDPTITTTDANGFYEFTGLPPGRYGVFQDHPADYYDAIDTKGSTGGIAINPRQTVSLGVLNQLVAQHKFDAIVQIPLPPGQHSIDNLFSEVRVEPLIPPPPEDPQPPQRILPLVLVPLAQQPDLVVLPPIIDPTPLLLSRSGPVMGYTWHLSVIDGGQPRNLTASTGPIMTPANAIFDAVAWSGPDMGRSMWSLGNSRREVFDKRLFGMLHGTPIAGDFNGDGISELGVFIDGQWFIDLNGNRIWDKGDLWARLGHDGDLPVVGDWDGDGKLDIGVFGPAWPGDPRAVAAEPGLPDPNNAPTGAKKNVPPVAEKAALGMRQMRLTSTGQMRSDLIDHVFHFGTAGDRPLVGDWNGDGVHTIGVFRNGKWHLDIDGDGKWSDADVVAHYGQSGDVPLVGDWNGDGVDQLAVYRAGKWHLDSNGDRLLDAHDEVFELGGADDMPVVGDWDGDGRDDPAVYHSGPQSAVGAEAVGASD